LRECLETQKKFNTGVEPNDFIAAFEKHMALEDPEGRGFAAIRNASKANLAEMESAGAVSDFDGEFGSFGGDQPGHLIAPESRKLGMATLKEKKGPARGLIGMVAWGIAAVLIGLLAILFMSSGESMHEVVNARSGSAPTSLAVEAKGQTVSAQVSKVDSTAATSEQGSQGKPVSAPIRPRLPEEVRKAKLPTMSEVQNALREQQSAGNPQKSKGRKPGGDMDLVEGAARR
jgi:hypothetical protein